MSKIEKRLVELGFSCLKYRNRLRTMRLGLFRAICYSYPGRDPCWRTATWPGLVGDTVTLEEAYLHAQRTGLALISAMKELLGHLDRVRRIVKLLGMVNAVKDFKDHPKVINGCSDLFCDVFGDAGRHARSAVGMGSLPGGITVEIETIVAINN